MDILRGISFVILIFAGLLAFGGCLLGISVGNENLSVLDAFRPIIIILSLYVIGSVLEKISKKPKVK